MTKHLTPSVPRSDLPLTSNVTPDWEQAPLRTFDRWHFYVDGPNTIIDDLRADLSPTYVFTHDPATGVYFANGDAGTLAVMSARVTEWATAHGLRLINTGPHAGMRRRDLDDLDPTFREAVFMEALSIGQRVMGRKRTEVAACLDRDEWEAQCAVWVLDFMASYDHETNVPFGAYVAQMVPKQISELCRRKHSRSVYEHEKKIKTAIREFEIAHHRSPTSTELAEALGVSRDKLHDMRAIVSTVQSMRNPAPVDSAPSDIDRETVVVRSDQDIESDVMDARARTDVALAMVESCLPRGGEANVLGFLAMYRAAYAGQSAAGLAGELGLNPRLLKREEKKARTRLVEVLTA